MELSKTKLNKILKKYRLKLESHDKKWQDTCSKLMKQKDLEGDRFSIDIPTIYDHEKHNSEGNQLFKELMAEFEGYEVFPKK